jgi:hypothetical protein
MSRLGRILGWSALIALPVVAGAQARGGQPVNQYGNPEKRAPRPTTAAITAADLMTRIYIFADDSMEGRNAPLESNARGNAYIARELARLRIAPAGDLGTYYQRLPYVQRTVSPRSALTVNGNALVMGTDFTVTSRGMSRIVDSARVIFAGVTSNRDQMIPPDSANNRFLLVVQPPAPPGAEGGGRGGRGGGRGAGAGGGQGVNLTMRYPNAVAIATIVPALGTPGAGGGRGGGRGGGPVLNDPTDIRATAQFQITEQAAARILGRPVADATPGSQAGFASALIMYDDVQVPHAANVLAMIPGSDSVLRNEIVVISAHNDHVGLQGQAVDHDSLRTARLQALGMQIRGTELDTLSVAQRTSITVNLDSLRRIRPARRDSIRNGADDDGSGSMALLEIAEAIQAMPTKPKRTIVFAWWTAEEDGLVGSEWWTDNATVPLVNVVANINLDMIGRGRAEDVPGGGPDYLGYLGANRLASVLEERVQAVNRRQPQPLRLDNRFDWPFTTPGWSAYNNIYGRSDHARFSRYNIPIVFFFTGLHADYHQVTDEPQYIDYPHYARIVSFVRDLTLDVGNLPSRPVVDRSGAVPPRPPR